MIEVLKPGLLTTVQDTGRPYYQQYGMVVGGAVDTYALKMANVLVGNPMSEAGIEMTMVGPVLKTDRDRQIAITGANMQPYVDGKQIPMCSSYLWKHGSVLEFQYADSGLRSYLAISDGLDVPVLMGSKSTYLPASIGGFKGRALQQGDRLQVTSGEMLPFQRRLAHEYIPSYLRNKTIRVVLGPHDRAFSEKGMKTFLNSPFVVSKQLNRMGMRLQGEKIEHKEKADIPSQAVAFGTIQVAADGQPMILLADRQTTGGYTIIASVITVDHSLLAQAKTGDVITFQAVTIEQAHKLWKEYVKLSKQLELLYCHTI